MQHSPHHQSSRSKSRQAPLPPAGGAGGGLKCSPPVLHILELVLHQTLGCAPKHKEHHRHLGPPLTPPAGGRGIFSLHAFSSFLISLLLLLTLSACGSMGMGGNSGNMVSGHGLPKTRPDPVAERYISLLHPHSGERLNVTYYHDGHYDANIMNKINLLFRDRHADVAGEIDPELIDYLVDIRTRLGLPPTVVFEILSGYRTRETNEKLAFTNGNVAPESLHMHGWAVDFRISHVNGSAISEIAKTMQRGGVSYYASDNHVHVDLGNIRTWHEK